jgi:hypothetical protein
MNTNTLRDLPVWLWLGLPLAMLLLTLYAYFASPELMMLLVRRDEHPDGGGIAENGTILVLLPGIAAGFAILLHYRKQLPLWLTGWLLGWTLACVYFAGEEASWGQHYIRWMTPDSLRGLNDQHETNLHNIGTWFDQKPRALVELWMVFAGLLVPVIRRFRPQALWANRDRARWFWPTRFGIPTVVAFLFSFVVAVIAKKTARVDLHLLGSNELREFYLAVFLSGYLLSLWYRLRQTA